MHDKIARQTLFYRSPVRQEARADTIGDISKTQIKARRLNLQRCQSVFCTDVSRINQAINLVIGEDTVWKTHYCVRLVCIIAKSTFTLTKAKASLYARGLMFKKV